MCKFQSSVATPPNEMKSKHLQISTISISLKEVCQEEVSVQLFLRLPFLHATFPYPLRKQPFRIGYSNEKIY